ncbi:MAG: Ycf66 family protein [Cyanobacteria bacterium J06648_10]
MFAHVLAVLVGISSFLFYIAAFFYPEVHRSLDWVWSTLGLLYAVVLWFCAGQMTGVVLLGQVVAIALLIALGWQTLSIRREKTPVYQQTPVTLTPELVSEWTKSKINQLRIAPETTPRPLPPQNRSLNATAAERFRPVTDPRRRPVYDYEFVEDGLLDARADVMSDTDAPTDVNADPGLVPPSVEAEVLSAVVPEKTQSENEADDPSPQASEPKTSEPKTSEPKTSEPKTADELLTDSPVVIETPKAETPEAETPKPETPLTQPVHPADSTPGPTPTDAFSTKTDAIKTEPVGEKTEAARESAREAAREKPSLLAVPVILLGWVKDVVSSLTRPKPSKPVIDIPRREPSHPAPAAVDPAYREPVTDNDPETWEASTSSADFEDDNSSQFDADNSANFDDDNSWADSNWAD